MYNLKKSIMVLLIIAFVIIPSCFAASEKRYRPASNLNVVNYARNLTLSIIDTNFRGSWVVNPEENEQSHIKAQRVISSLSQVKIGKTLREVKKILGNPSEVKGNGRILLYGLRNEDGSYKDLTQIFLDEKLQRVIAVTSFNPKNIVENIGVSIGDPIDRIISVYGEPVDEKDFIEDQDNKDYLGMYYLYPRSGIGFLIGQNKGTKNPIVQGILVFGNIQ
jgi:hypothetical protein